MILTCYTEWLLTTNLLSRTMRTRKTVLFTILLFLLCSCNDADYYYSTMFTSCYSNIDSIHLEISKGDSNLLLIGVSDSYYASIADDDKTTINQLAAKHNDTSYNKMIAYAKEGNWTEEGHGGWRQDFVRIDITSNADYDETHKARTLLNDIIRLRSTTVYPYIMSGYTKTFDWSTTKYIARPECHLIDGLLSELSSENLIMAGWENSTVYAELYFVKYPTHSRQHRLTIVMESDEGEIFTDSLDLIF